MNNDLPTLLIVEDDEDVAEMLQAYFHIQGYIVKLVNWGEDALPACLEAAPNLVILDIRLPDIDGYEVARRLRAHRKTNQIPIIFLTDQRARASKLKGLALGADDYVTKPFDVQELRLRVRNALKRAHLGNFTNPVTGLPEGTIVKEKLDSCVRHQDWSILLISIDNLDQFREMYGFIASDDALRAISLMINTSVRDYGKEDDFIGHLNQTTLLILTKPATINPLKMHLLTRLEQSIDFFYPLKDRTNQKDSNSRLSITYHELSGGMFSFAKTEDLLNQLSSLSKKG
jgi:PleD family two-component response regulator